MFNTYCKTVFIAFLVATIFGCGGEADEAKKLGFSSVDEMKAAHAKGWHTQQKYFEDNPNLARSQQAGSQQTAQSTNSNSTLSDAQKASRQERCMRKGDFGLEENYCARGLECASQFSYWGSTAGGVLSNNVGQDKVMRDFMISKGILDERAAIVAMDNGVINAKMIILLGVGAAEAAQKASAKCKVYIDSVMLLVADINAGRL